MRGVCRVTTDGLNAGRARRSTLAQDLDAQRRTVAVGHWSVARELHSETFRPPAAPVYGTLIWPPAAPVAAVVLICGSRGQEPDYLARSLATAGIAGLSVSYFGRPHLPPSLANIELRYFERALDLLRARWSTQELR